MYDMITIILFWMPVSIAYYFADKMYEDKPNRNQVAVSVALVAFVIQWARL